jgi:hypothetical protein
MRGSVPAADDHVGMDLGPALLDCNVPDQREKFELLFHIRGYLVSLRLPVKPANPGVGERANPLEAAASELLFESELLEIGQDLVPRVEDEDEGLGLIGNLFMVHTHSLPVWMPIAQPPKARTLEPGWRGFSVKKRRTSATTVVIATGPL